MASQVEIANLALTKLGAERILSFSQDNKQARSLSAIFGGCRDDEIRKHNWNFAMSRVSLAADPAAPEWGFSRQFRLPSDCLRLVQVNDATLPVGNGSWADILGCPFQVEGRMILTDLGAPLRIRFLQRVTDTSAYDSCFDNVLAIRLAIELCEDLTQSSTKKDSLKMDYRAAISAAVLSDAIENPPQAIAEDPWIMARQ